MKRVVVLFTLIMSVTFTSNGQNTMKLRYPKCELANADVVKNTKGIKVFEITTKEEFDKYFILPDSGKINFETNMVLAAIVGEDKEGKFVQIDAASYISSKARSLYVRYDVRDKEETNFYKFCVAVIQKPNYKKVSFLKGKFYNMAISGE